MRRALRCSVWTARLGGGFLRSAEGKCDDPRRTDRAVFNGWSGAVGSIGLVVQYLSIVDYRWPWFVCGAGNVRACRKCRCISPIGWRVLRRVHSAMRCVLLVWPDRVALLNWVTLRWGYVAARWAWSDRCMRGSNAREEWELRADISPGVDSPNLATARGGGTRRNRAAVSRLWPSLIWGRFG